MFKKYMILALALILALGAVRLYGASEYRRGKQAAHSASLAQRAAVLEADSTIWRETRDRIRKTDDLDAVAADLGILRPDDRL